MDDLFEPEWLENTCQHMHVIVHHDESDETVAFAIEMTQGSYDQVSLRRSQLGLAIGQPPRDEVERIVDVPVRQLPAVIQLGHVDRYGSLRSP